MKILITDHGKAHRKILAHLLAGLGEPAEAKNGRETLNAIQEALEKRAPFDLAIIDLETSDIEGVHVLAGIRKLEDDFAIPLDRRAILVATSSKTDDDAVIKSQKFSQAFLPKPFAKEELDKAVEAAVAKGSGPRVKNGKGPEPEPQKNDDIPRIMEESGKTVFFVESKREDGSVERTEISPEAHRPYASMRAGRPVARLLSGRVEAGNGMRFDNATGIFTSETGGRVEFDGAMLSINEVMTITGDLRLQSLDFEGGIRIGGSVKNGLTIRAGKSVEIAGDVGESRIEAGENITAGKVYGSMRTPLSCGGHFKAEAVYNSHVEALGDLTVEKEALNSILRSGAKIQAETIVGGEATALRLVRLDRAGSQRGVSTKIEAGVDFRISSAADEGRERLEVLAQETQKLDRMLGVDGQQSIPAPDAGLSDAKKARIEEMLAQRAKLASEIAEIKADVEKADQEAISRPAAVRVLKKVHKKTIIRICGGEAAVEEDMDGPLVLNDKNMESAPPEE